MEKYPSQEEILSVGSLTHSTWKEKNYLKKPLPVADPWSRGQACGARPHLIFCQTEARRGEKSFWETAHPVPLSKGLDDRGPALSQVLDPALLTDHSQMY